MSTNYSIVRVVRAFHKTGSNLVYPAEQKNRSPFWGGGFFISAGWEPSPKGRLGSTMQPCRFGKAI